MKKISLLAIASFFSALAFAQNAATTQTVPGQPKAHAATPAKSSATPSFTNAAGIQTSTKITPAQATKYKAIAAKQAAATTAADKAQPQIKN